MVLSQNNGKINCCFVICMEESAHYKSPLITVLMKLVILSTGEVIITTIPAYRGSNYSLDSRDVQNTKIADALPAEAAIMSSTENREG